MYTNIPKRFLFNPFSVMVCCALSLHTIFNFILFLTFYFALSGKTFLLSLLLIVLTLHLLMRSVSALGNAWVSTLFLGSATYLQLYPAVLIFPLSGMVFQNWIHAKRNVTRIGVLFRCTSLLVLWFGLLSVVSFRVMKSMSFLDSVYGFM